MRDFTKEEWDKIFYICKLFHGRIVSIDEEGDA